MILKKPISSFFPILVKEPFYPSDCPCSSERGSIRNLHLYQRTKSWGVSDPPCVKGRWELQNLPSNRCSPRLLRLLPCSCQRPSLRALQSRWQTAPRNHCWNHQAPIGTIVRWSFGRPSQKLAEGSSYCTVQAKRLQSCAQELQESFPLGCCLKGTKPCIAGKAGSIGWGATTRLPMRIPSYTQLHSCMHLVLALRLMQQNCLDSSTPLVVCYIDLQRAFDSPPPKQLIIDRLRHIGAPPALTEVVEKMNGSCEAFMTGDKDAKFHTTRGVKQGDPLGPLLFNVAFDAILEKCDLPSCGLGLAFE